jgi:hypothetical protein
MASWIKTLINSLRNANYKFEVGDQITMIDDEFLYYRYYQMARQMNLGNWKMGYFPCIGDIGYVVERDFHPYKKVYVYGIEAPDGNQYVMGEPGIK